jgi:DNA-binding GntR family transcriptional regulator
MATAEIQVDPLEAQVSLKDQIYSSLRRAITAMNIYSEDAELRLDERQLSERLAISRTPIREALARLEQEGLVKIVPRKGVFIVRKTKTEILEMITVWAALEGMAARLATQRASDEEIASLRDMFGEFDAEGEDSQIEPYHLDEYSETNIRFHSAIIALSRCALIAEMTANLFIHMRGIRARTISEKDRAKRSITDHLHIIEALEARDTELAERLVREHTLNLARHVEEHVDYLD